MVKNKISKPLRNKYIMEQKKAGKTSIEIGDEVGLNQRQVNRTLGAHKQNGRLQKKREENYLKLFMKVPWINLTNKDTSQ